METVSKAATLTFVKDKETRNTVRFQEQTEEAPVIGTLYVQKWFVKGAERVTVTVTV